MKRPKDQALRHTSFASDRAARDKPRLTLEQRFADEARFIKAWIDHPLATGSVYPSGKVLSRAMAQAVDPTIAGPVVELGPGTGPVTEALIQRGIAQERLVLVEFDPDFCRLLARRYPRATIVEGDAYALAHSLGPVLDRKAAAIVSSLPLLTKPERKRLALLAEAFALMDPAGVFVQFTYGLRSPVPRVDDEFHPAGFCAAGSPPIWLNLPPARVWTYRSGAAIAATQSRVSPDLRLRIKLGTEKIGDEWRETRDRVRQEFRVRAEKAKAELRARTEKVRIGLKGNDRPPDLKRPVRPARRKPEKRTPHW